MALALAAAAAVPAGAQVTVSTGTPTNGVTPFGLDSDFGSIPTVVAQTFMLPSGAYLLNFVQG